MCRQFYLLSLNCAYLCAENAATIKSLSSLWVYICSGGYSVCLHFIVTSEETSSSMFYPDRITGPDRTDVPRHEP